MDDPVLEALQIIDAERVYHLGGAEPFSIRDQMLRGTVLVKRLFAKGTIGPQAPTARLLVVGAGAAGVTAALAAEDLGVNTVLVDEGWVPFVLQRRADHRFVDPTQYDWPVDHWAAARLPWHPLHDELKLDFVAGNGPTLARTWKDRFDDVINNSRILQVRWNTQARESSTPARGLLIPVDFYSTTTQPPSHSSTEFFDVVIWSPGAGAENCRAPDFKAPDYESPPFWGPISFLRRYLVDDARVIVSGGGDGALQDFLHATTDLPSAAEVYRRCILNVLPQAETDRIHNTILSAEERALRGRSWAKGRQSEIRYLGELQHIHQEQVDKAYDNGAVKTALRNLIKVAHAPNVLLVHRGPYLACNYGLNRFTFLLVAKFIKEDIGDPVLANTTITKVTSADGHQCVRRKVPSAGTPDPGMGYEANGPYDGEQVLVDHDCHGKDHDVFLEVDGVVEPAARHFDYIIIRHGKANAPAYPKPGALRHPRRMFVYHLFGL